MASVSCQFPKPIYPPPLPHNFIFRKAKDTDIPIVHTMIQELANYENMRNGPKLTVEELKRDAGLADGKELCQIYVLDFKREKETQNKPVTIGYAICFFSYSTWEGKSYFLEDLFIKKEYRNVGAGSFMFKQLVCVARELGCKRVDFHVLASNAARVFYEHRGALNLTECEKWNLYRLSEQNFSKVEQSEY